MVTKSLERLAQELHIVKNDPSHKHFKKLMMLGSGVIGYAQAQGIDLTYSLGYGLMLTAIPLTNGFYQGEVFSRQKEFYDCGGVEYMLENNLVTDEDVDKLKTKARKMNSISMEQAKIAGFTEGVIVGGIVGGIANGICYAVGYGLGKLV